MWTTLLALALGSIVPAATNTGLSPGVPTQPGGAKPLTGSTTSSRLNVLLIVADDLGKEWLSCYGSECHKTPNLDRLAAGGLRFDNFYATPLCTPTRHELLTGRYPFRTGWTVHYDTPRWGGQYFDWNRETTWARVLKSAGYATTIAGKWQMNDFRVHPDALARHGFDEHCIWPGFETGNPPSEQRYFGPFIQVNGERRTWSGQFGDDVFSKFIIDFMTRNKDKPFCAYYPMALSHTPFTKTPRHPESTARGIALFPDMVDYVDELVGRLLQAIDDLQIGDRTLVLFMGDNGTVSGVECRARGLLVDGGKGGMTERGICVPFMARCPGLIPPGRATDDLADGSDLMPTLAELAGAPLPQGVVLDGESFLNTLRGQVDTRPQRRWIYSQLGTKRAVRDKRFKLHSDGAFYDLAADPLERDDLAADVRPEIAMARERLKAVLMSLPADAKLPFPPSTHPAGPG